MIGEGLKHRQSIEWSPFAPCMAPQQGCLEGGRQGGREGEGEEGAWSGQHQTQTWKKHAG